MRAVSVVLFACAVALVACKPRKKPVDTKTPTAKAAGSAAGKTAAKGAADDEDDEDGEDAKERSAPLPTPPVRADGPETSLLRTRLRTFDFADPQAAAKQVGPPQVTVKKDAAGGCGEMVVGKKTIVLDCDEDDEVKGASVNVIGEDELADGSAPVNLPEAVDLRAKRQVGPVLDQGPTLTCTAVSLAAVLNAEIGARTGRPGDVSPMQIWGRYHKPSMDAAVVSNEGKGIAPMTLLPYDAREADGWGKGRPVPRDLLSRLEPQSVVRVTDVVKVGLKDIKGELAQGHAVWFAIHGGHGLQKTVPVGADRNGPQMIPAYDYRRFPANQKMGHALAMVGYQTAKNGKTFYLMQNSWGREFGEDGFAYIDEDTLARNLKQAYTLEVQPAGGKPAPVINPSTPPTKCKTGLLPDAATGKCAPKCPDGSARNDNSCAETTADCAKGEVNVKGKCVRAAPSFKTQKDGYVIHCVPGGCVYGFQKGVAGCTRDKGCVVACPSPNFKLVKRASGLGCN